ncbi:CaMKMT, partial [Symbiodinium necroappetens]
ERGLLDGDPSWAHVWPSAAALGALLAGRPQLVEDKRVAELGAGLGLCGLVSAAVGARTVLLLDREPRALHCAVASAELGKLAVQEVGAACGVQAAVYDWDAPQSFGEPVDVILAAEVLYDVTASKALAAASLCLLRGE